MLDEVAVGAPFEDALQGASLDGQVVRMLACQQCVQRPRLFRIDVAGRRVLEGAELNQARWNVDFPLRDACGFGHLQMTPRRAQRTLDRREFGRQPRNLGAHFELPLPGNIEPRQSLRQQITRRWLHHYLFP